VKTILVTGALGQIGSELVTRLRSLYGDGHVVGTDIRSDAGGPTAQGGPFETLDVTDGERFFEIGQKYHVDAVIHLAAVLSARAETTPQFAWHLNMTGLVNALETARQLQCQLFTPSSIAAFGPSTPSDATPQDTIQRPNTIYGVTKVAGELLCDYYHHRFGVDTRGVRFPGLISYVTPPGGGTTDYAVEIYYHAVQEKKYTSYIAAGTKMDMMYMPDALDAIVQLMEADPAKLVHRNAFNISAMSFAPEDVGAAIRARIPEFTLTYDVDPVRQRIADSWPNSIDSSCAVAEWDFRPRYDLESMTTDMLEKLAGRRGLLRS